MTTYSTLLVEAEAGVVTVTLNRPAKRNAINAAMFDELRAAFEAIASDDDARAFILTGAGGSFCSGVDLSALEELPTSPDAMSRRMAGIHEVLRAVACCPKPGVAAVAGHAAGGGASLALACDLVVMADDAAISWVFVRRGLAVDMSGTFFLPRAVGLHRAKELALLGDTIGATRAYEMGIANRVVAPNELVPAARALAERLAAGPPLAMARIKAALNESFSRGFDQALGQESVDQTAIFQTADVAEALAAWIGKRAPRFTGH